MALEEVSRHTLSTYQVEVSPSEVYAGADITLKARVSCSQACDLLGQTLLILDQDGILVEKVEITEFDEEAGGTSNCIVKAPARAGTYSWLAIFTSREKAGVLHEQTSEPFSFTVKPHPTSMSVWGVPSAIPSGDSFTVKVGIKCSDQCALTAEKFAIHNHEGRQLATGTLRSDPWPGTTALYFTEIKLDAPETEGYYKWDARFPESDSEIPHEECSLTFGVRIVSAPECEVTIEAIDKDDNTPIKGVQVLLHPFRAVTDEHGLAKLRISKGEYTLHISGFRYLPFHTTVKVTGDMVTKAELYWKPYLDEYELSTDSVVQGEIQLLKAAQEKRQLKAKQQLDMERAALQKEGEGNTSKTSST